MVFNLARRFALFIALLLASLSSSAFADTYRFNYTPDPSVGFWDAGRLVQFETLFSTENNTLSFTANIAPSSQTGKLPQVFAVGMTAEALANYDGEMAFFYIDITNFSSPKLSVYAFNSASPINSWQDGSKSGGTQTPDRIVSTEAPPGTSRNPTGWIKDLFTRNESNGTITIGFKIDSTSIQNHTALYQGGAWKGAKILQYANVLTRMVSGVSLSYNGAGTGSAQGFLSSLTFSQFGGFGVSGFCGAAENPICDGLQSTYSLLVGQHIDLSINARDPQGDPLTVNYFGVPNGASVNPADGSTNPSPLTALISWTPGTGTENHVYTVGATFTDPHGVSATCQTVVTVLPNPVSCHGSSGTQDVAIGQPFTASVRGENSEGASLRTDYTGHPTDAVITPGNGSTNPSPVDVLFNWTPKASDAGRTYNVNIKFTDQQGRWAVCPFGVHVTNQCNLQIDRCGVCGGDGTSCLGCQDEDVFDNLLAFDASTSALSTEVMRVGKILRSYGVTKADKKYGAFVIAEAKSKQIKSWTLTWQQDQKIVVCSNTVFCTDVIMEKGISDLRSLSKDLRDLGYKGLKRALRIKKNVSSKTIKRLRRLIDRLYEQNSAIGTTLPTKKSICN